MRPTNAITYENLEKFAFSNDKQITGEVKGIVIEFNHLYWEEMLIDTDDPAPLYKRSPRGAEYMKRAQVYAKAGVIFVFPYTSPWSWMNNSTVALADRVLDILIEKYELKNSKIVAQGMSMGGGNTLAFSHLTKHKLAGCMSSCGVCDLVYHYSERLDLPRTIMSAFGAYEGSLEDALKTVSPIHNLSKLQKVPYLLFTCAGDDLVDKTVHADRMVPAMQAEGLQVEHVVIPERGHVDMPADQWDRYFQFGIDIICG